MTSYDADIAVGSGVSSRAFASVAGLKLPVTAGHNPALGGNPDRRSWRCNPRPE
jgi:hypothetical protein